MAYDISAVAPGTQVVASLREQATALPSEDISPADRIELDAALRWVETCVGTLPDTCDVLIGAGTREDGVRDILISISRSPA